MVKMVKTTDREGNEFETEVGADGVNPVSVNNPPAGALADDKAVDEVKDAQDQEAERYEEGVPGASDASTASEDGGTGDDAPAKNASTEDWVNYAVNEKGADREDAEAKTRDELIAEYGN